VADRLATLSIGSKGHRMGYQTIEIRKSTPQIGAEILSVDLSRPLGSQQFQEVHDALMDRLVIFFRDQTISVEQRKDFVRRFGKLHTHPASQHRSRASRGDGDRGGREVHLHRGRGLALRRVL
jgi:alpha-ketoglutarate-dependent taurine dioxygenase